MNEKNERGKIDWMITLLPLGIVIALCVLFFFVPEQSNAVLSQIRFFFGDTFGTYYLVIGLGIFILSLYIAGSRYGNIVLGEPNEKPKYSFFAWGSMMFTCGLAADILFYSFSEWVLYATDPHIEEMGTIQDWAGVYPLFLKHVDQFSVNIRMDGQEGLLICWQCLHFWLVQRQHLVWQRH